MLKNGWFPRIVGSPKMLGSLRMVCSPTKGWFPQTILVCGPLSQTETSPYQMRVCASLFLQDANSTWLSIRPKGRPKWPKSPALSLAPGLTARAILWCTSAGYHMAQASSFWLHPLLWHFVPRFFCDLRGNVHKNGWKTSGWTLPSCARP